MNNSTKNSDFFYFSNFRFKSVLKWLLKYTSISRELNRKIQFKFTLQITEKSKDALTYSHRLTDNISSILLILKSFIFVRK